MKANKEQLISFLIILVIGVIFWYTKFNPNPHKNIELSHKEVFKENQTLEVLKEAEKYSDLFVQGDYEEFLNYVMPEHMERLLAIYGSREEIINFYTSEGNPFTKIEVSEPEAIIYEELENMYVTFVPNKMYMKSLNPDEPELDILFKESFLMAISYDGKQWYFIDGGTIPVESFNKYLPETSSRLKIPPIINVLENQLYEQIKESNIEEQIKELNK